MYVPDSLLLSSYINCAVTCFVITSTVRRCLPLLSNMKSVCASVGSMMACSPERMMLFLEPMLAARNRKLPLKDKRYNND